MKFSLYGLIKDVPSKSKTGKGFTYCFNQEKNVRIFLIDGEVPQNNNAVETGILHRKVELASN